MSPPRLPLREQVRLLKRRRDALLCRACTLEERPALLAEVVRLNREVSRLERRLRGR